MRAGPANRDVAREGRTNNLRRNPSANRVEPDEVLSPLAHPRNL